MPVSTTSSRQDIQMTDAQENEPLTRQKGRELATKKVLEGRTAPTTELRATRKSTLAARDKAASTTRKRKEADVPREER
jgi:hypothetical protein